MFLGFFDPLYFVFLAPGLALSLYATFKTRRTFSKYSDDSQSGMTGAQAAARMLQRNGIHGVSIEQTSGWLSDHYDPGSKALRLSEAVYSSQSLSAIGVACHEAGHAIQDANNYGMLSLRTGLVPATNFCSTASYILLMIGFFTLMIGSFIQTFVLLGVGLFTVSVVFSLITLPVEWDASKRAKIAMDEAGLLSPAESKDASKVLNAAFLTYLAAAVTSLLTLLYYLVRLGFLGGGDE